MSSRSRLAVLLLLASCGGSTSISTSVGPGGGLVSADGASVSIPAGALASSVMITVAPTTVAAPTDTMSVGTPYLFGPEGTQFAIAATVTLAFDPALLPAGATSSDVRVYTAPAGSTQYVALPTILSDATHVQASTTHFSIFVAAIPLHQTQVADAGTDASAHVDAAMSDDLGVPDLARVDLAREDLTSADGGV